MTQAPAPTAPLPDARLAGAHDTESAMPEESPYSTWLAHVMMTLITDHTSALTQDTVLMYALEYAAARLEEAGEHNTADTRTLLGQMADELRNP